MTIIDQILSAPRAPAQHGVLAPPVGDGDPARINELVRGGGRIVVLTSPSGPNTSIMLDAVLSGLANPILRIANPLKAPLSLSRLALQAGADPAADDEATALKAAVLDRAIGGLPLVLAIDDAHTLEPDALLALAGLVEPHNHPPALQLVLAGRPALLDLLAPAGLEARTGMETLMLAQPGNRTEWRGSADNLNRPPPTTVRPPASPAKDGNVADASPATAKLQPGGKRLPADPIVPRLNEIWLVTGLLAIVAAFLLMLSPPEPASTPQLAPGAVAGAAAVAAPGAIAPEPLASAVPPASRAAGDPAPTNGAVAGTAAAQGPAPEPEASGASNPPTVPQGERLLAGISESRLRLDFGAFLHRTGYAAQTPEAQDALFQEYKEWLARNGSGPAPGRIR